MPALFPMPDPIARVRLVAGMGNPFATAPRSPSWERPGVSCEPVDPSPDVIQEAIEAALEALADAQLDGSEADVEATEARLERYQRVVDRHNRKEDDQLEDDLSEPIDDWSDVVWLDDEAIPKADYSNVKRFDVAWNEGMEDGSKRLPKDAEQAIEEAVRRAWKPGGAGAKG